jgi:hypothetical protein
MPDRVYTSTEVARLAALSRAYHEARGDIIAAVVQELKRELDPDWLGDVAARFGLSRQETARYQAADVKRLYYGYIHRAKLATVAEVYARVLADLEMGRLKPGDQLPPRTRFTQDYHCDKKTHGEVVERLTRNGVVHRPGGPGGPLYVL